MSSSNAGCRLSWLYNTLALSRAAGNSVSRREEGLNKGSHCACNATSSDSPTSSALGGQCNFRSSKRDALLVFRNGSVLSLEAAATDSIAEVGSGLSSLKGTVVNAVVLSDAAALAGGGIRLEGNFAARCGAPRLGACTSGAFGSLSAAPRRGPCASSPAIGASAVLT